ncbi:WD_REPEATS_REGION domain-containing protein, partial [Linnemannia schmuckeri]
MLRHSAGVVSGLVKVLGLIKLNLEAIVEGLGSVFEITDTAYEGLCFVMESGRGVMDSLKEYAAIRAAQALVQAGQLEDLNRLICKAPCRRKLLFQWGVCQLLGEIASDSSWDTTVRQQVIDLLEHLYNNDPQWAQDESVRSFMLNIIGQLATSADLVVSASARTLLMDLDQDQGTIITNLLHPLRSRLPLPASSSLLTRVLDIPDVEYDLHKLRIQRLEEQKRGVYVLPQAKPSLQTSDDTLFPLMEKALEFLKGHRQVLLILGDSGAGKSTFNLELEHILWKDYRKYGPIPLYISLPTIDDPAHNLVEKRLQYHNFSKEQIREMKLHRQF